MNCFSDEQLALSAQGGDEESLDLLLGRYKNWVKAIVRSVIFKDAAFPDDLIQEGMIGLYKAIVQYSADKGASFKSFATLCIKRQTIDALRHFARGKNRPLSAFVEFNDRNVAELPPDARATDPESVFISDETGSRLWGIVKETLGEEELTLFKLYLDGLSYQEIGDRMSVTAKRVDNSLQRIKRNLKKAFRAAEKPNEGKQ